MLAFVVCLVAFAFAVPQAGVEPPPVESAADAEEVVSEREEDDDHVASAPKLVSTGDERHAPSGLVRLIGGWPAPLAVVAPPVVVPPPPSRIAAAARARSYFGLVQILLASDQPRGPTALS